MTRHMQNRMNQPTKLLVMLGATLVYSLVFILLFPKFGTAVGTFEILPAIVIAWLFGVRIGAVYTIFVIFITDLILFPIVGHNAIDMLDAGFLTGAIVTLIMAAIVGRLHDLQLKLNIELSDKKKVEDDLRQLSEALESHVRERTEALEASEVYYRTLFQNSVMPIVIYDHDGKILDANTLAAKNMGATPEQIIGKSIYEILPYDTTLNFLERLQDIFETGTGLLHEEAIELPNDTRWFLTNAQPIFDADQNVTAVHVVAQDITELKKTEEALSQSEARLRQAQKLEAVGRLAGGIAHDFNNILTVIISYSDLLQRNNPTDSSVHQQARIIKESGEKAAHITRQLLAFSRKQVLAPTVSNLNTAVGSIMDMLEHLIGEHIELEVQLEPNLWACKADTTQIEQVILNLVINGRDAMPNGGTLTIATGNLEIPNQPHDLHADIKPGRYVTLSVKDTGVGMDAETQAKIFEPFYTTKDFGKGTGLGLATVHGIITQSSGAIRVYSEPERGTKFEIYLPQAMSENTDIRENGEFHLDHSLNGSETILLVEDEASIRLLAQQILEQYGYTVITADSHQALEVCQSSDNRIHLLLTDVVMPELSGPALAKQIGQQFPDIKILYMSGYNEGSVHLEGIELHGEEYIQKPFTPSGLVSKIRNLLDSMPV